jgi:hypothetical protein
MTLAEPSWRLAGLPELSIEKLARPAEDPCPSSSGQSFADIKRHHDWEDPKKNIQVKKNMEVQPTSITTPLQGSKRHTRFQRS